MELMWGSAGSANGIPVSDCASIASAAARAWQNAPSIIADGCAMGA